MQAEGSKLLDQVSKSMRKGTEGRAKTILQTSLCEQELAVNA